MIIRLVNANLGKATNIETNVETWGELQTEEDVREFMSGDTQAVIRENQNTLDSDRAELPTEKLTDEDKDYDFTLFFITKKSKAGTDQYEDMGFQELRRECSRRDSIEGDRGNYGSSVEMREALRADDAANSASTEGCNVSSSFQDAVLSKLDSIEAKVDALADGGVVASSPAEEEEEEDPYAATEDELAEAQSLQREIG